MIVYLKFIINLFLKIKFHNTKLIIHKISYIDPYTLIKKVNGTNIS